MYQQNIPNYKELKIETNGIITEIKETNNLKYLGVIIDKNLKCDKHINNVTKITGGLLFKFKYL